MTEYHLSEAGRELKAVIEALGAWGVRWAFGEPRPEELDAGLLVWKIHQRINCELLPETRTVVEFDFAGSRGRRVWLLLARREVSVCVTPPGSTATSSSAPIWRSSTVSGWDRSDTTPPFDAAAWSWKERPLLRSSCHGGSCGVRWRASSVNASSRWHGRPRRSGRAKSEPCDGWRQANAGRLDEAMSLTSTSPATNPPMCAM